MINYVIIYCYLTCVMINWLICWDFWNWGFQSLDFCSTTLCSSQFWVFQKYNWTILNALEHASCGYFVHASYRLFFFIFCAVIVFDVVCPWFFFSFFFSSFLSLFYLPFPTLSIMVRKTRAHRTSTFSTLAFDSERFLSEKNQETYEKLNILRFV